MLQNLKDYKVLRGYDVVSYFYGAPQMGNPSIIAIYREGVYQFVNQEHKDMFIQNPDKYRPAYGGFCAIAMTEGSTVDAHPEAYIIQDDRLFVFYAIKLFGILWQDTRKQWGMKSTGNVTMADAVYEKLSTS